MLTCVLSGFQLGIADNLLTDQVKVGIFDTGLVQELSPFLWFFFFTIGLLLGIYFGIIRKTRQVCVCQDKGNITTTDRVGLDGRTGVIYASNKKGSPRIVHVRKEEKERKEEMENALDGQQQTPTGNAMVFVVIQPRTKGHMRKKEHTAQVDGQTDRKVYPETSCSCVFVYA